MLPMAIYRSRLLRRLTLLLLVASPAAKPSAQWKRAVPRYIPILLQSRAIRVHSTATIVGD